MMGKKSIGKLKLLVTSIILLFFFQETLIFNNISEPYPALRMPSFSGNNMNKDGLYETTSVDIEIEFKGGDYLFLTPREFFYDVPVSHHWSLLTKFKPAAKPKEKNIFHNYGVLRLIFIGYYKSRQLSTYEIQHSPETKEWLNNHIHQIFPKKDLERISFYWFKDFYSQKELNNRVRSLDGTTSITLKKG